MNRFENLSVLEAKIVWGLYILVKRNDYKHTLLANYVISSDILLKHVLCDSQANSRICSSEWSQRGWSQTVVELWKHFLKFRVMKIFIEGFEWKITGLKSDFTNSDGWGLMVEVRWVVWKLFHLESWKGTLLLWLCMLHCLTHKPFPAIAFYAFHSWTPPALLPPISFRQMTTSW